MAVLGLPPLLLPLPPPQPPRLLRRLLPEAPLPPPQPPRLLRRLLPEAAADVVDNALKNWHLTVAALSAADAESTTSKRPSSNEKFVSVKNLEAVAKVWPRST